MIELKPHVLPGVVVPLTITLIALSMPSVRRDIQKNVPLLAIGTLISFAISMSLAYIFNIGRTPYGFAAMHVIPVASMFMYFGELLKANRKQIYSLNPFAGFAVTFITMVVVDIVGAEVLGIGAEWVGGAGWLDALVWAPGIFAVLFLIANVLLKIQTNKEQCV